MTLSVALGITISILSPAPRHLPPQTQKEAAMTMAMTRSRSDDAVFIAIGPHSAHAINNGSRGQTNGNERVSAPGVPPRNNSPSPKPPHVEELTTLAFAPTILPLVGSHPTSPAVTEDQLPSVTPDHSLHSYGGILDALLQVQARDDDADAEARWQDSSPLTVVDSAAAALSYDNAVGSLPPSSEEDQAACTKTDKDTIEEEDEYSHFIGRYLQEILNFDTTDDDVDDADVDVVDSGYRPANEDDTTSVGDSWAISRPAMMRNGTIDVVEAGYFDDAHNGPFAFPMDDVVVVPPQLTHEGVAKETVSFHRSPDYPVYTRTETMLKDIRHHLKNWHIYQKLAMGTEVSISFGLDRVKKADRKRLHRLSAILIQQINGTRPLDEMNVRDLDTTTSIVENHREKLGIGSYSIILAQWSKYFRKQKTIRNRRARRVQTAEPKPDGMCDEFALRDPIKTVENFIHCLQIQEQVEGSKRFKILPEWKSFWRRADRMMNYSCRFCL